MRSAIVVLALVGGLPSVGRADPPLKLRNSLNVTLFLFIRPVGQPAFGPPAKLAAMADTDVPLDGEDPYFVELGLEDGSRVIPDRPAPLRMLAATGMVFDIGAAFEVVVDPTGRKRTVLGAAFLKGRDGTNLTFKPLPQPLRDLMRSTWDTEYRTPDGQTVAAAVKLEQARGEFQTTAFQGKLSDVHYTIDGETYVIQGRWQAPGAQGAFTWKVGKDDRRQFVGEWTETGSDQRYPWTGKRR